MNMLKNIFKSDNKYYLELDETNGSQSTEAAVVKTPTKVAEPQPVQETATTSDQVADVSPADQVGDVAPEKVAESQLVEEVTATATEKKKGKKSATKAQTKPVTTVKKTAVPPYEPPFWVAAMYNNNGSSNDNNNGNGDDSNKISGQTFATENLMPVITNYRRRPGPSLNKFIDMASKARTPRR